MRYLVLCLALVACGSADPSEARDGAVADARAEDAIVDGAADTSDAPTDTSTDVSDVAPTADASAVTDAVTPADAGVPADTTDAADAPSTMPAPTDRAPMQVWLSINSGAFERDASGICYRDASGIVRVRAWLGSVAITPTGARASVALQCGASVDMGFSGLRHVEFRDALGGVIAVNTGASMLLDPPSTCRDSRTVVERIDLRAFGCGPATSP